MVSLMVTTDMRRISSGERETKLDLADPHRKGVRALVRRASLFPFFLFATEGAKSHQI